MLNWDEVPKPRQRIRQAPRRRPAVQQSITLLAIAVLVASGAAPAPASLPVSSPGRPAADPPSFAEVQLSTGIRLRYAVQGDPEGRPVILLHGVTDSWFSWSRILPLLPSAWRVYALDQRGLGGTSAPGSGYGLPALADDVVAFLDAKGIERATVIGHSMGSLVAQHVAAGAPERVSRLVLVDAAIAGFFAPDARADLARISAPTLLLWGKRDAVFSRGDQEALLAGIAGSHLITYPETGHAPHWERPDQVARDLQAFLAGR
ncbi:MAG: alpha/beta fold hydrolase [Gemmatimonadales bacterium]